MVFCAAKFPLVLHFTLPATLEVGVTSCARQLSGDEWAYDIRKGNEKADTESQESYLTAPRDHLLHDVDIELQVASLNWLGEKVDVWTKLGSRLIYEKHSHVIVWI